MYPDGGQDWVQGVGHSLAWNDSGTGASNVKIELFKGGVFNRVVYSSTENDGHDAWLVPADQTPGTDYKIKISTISSSPITDMSDDYFTIHEPGTITLTSPNGGEKWVRETTHDITWSSSGYVGTTIDIELFKGGVYDSMVRASAENTGHFSWDIPADLSLGFDYKIKIASTGFEVYEGFSDISDDSFEVAAGIITVTSPNGGESWARGGASHEITWSDVGPSPPNVNIYLYKDGGYDSIIVLNTPNDGSYSWSIPAELATGSTYQVEMVGWFGGQMVYDLSDSYFTIAGITVTVPNGGESWARGSTHAITWSSEPYAGSVNIMLFKASMFYTTIVGSTSNDGYYEWLIPDSLTLGTDFRVQVASTSEPWSDISDSYFTISGINVISPNGGEKLSRGSTYAITWSFVGTVGSNVKIELLQGSTVVYDEITPNDGSLTVLIPAYAPVGSNYKIRITSVSYPSISDISDGYFAVI